MQYSQAIPRYAENREDQPLTALAVEQMLDYAAGYGEGFNDGAVAGSKEAWEHVTALTRKAKILGRVEGIDEMLDMAGAYIAECIANGFENGWEPSPEGLRKYYNQEQLRKLWRQPTQNRHG